MKIIVQSESIRGNEENAGASLKFIILGVTRMRNLKIIFQSESIRGNEENVCESEIYYSRPTRVANIKSLYKVKVLEAMKMCNKLEIYYSKCD